MATYTGKETLYEYMKEDIPDGKHTVVLGANGENVSINIEMYNFYGNVTYTGIDSLGDDVDDSGMLVLKYHDNLTIASGAVFRPKRRKKGMLIWVNGELINNGTISMTARGARGTGQNVYLYKNPDNTFEYVPAVGGLGAIPLADIAHEGVSAANATGRALAGGGAGAARFSSRDNMPGRGGNATSYSGGPGGGGFYDIYMSAVAGSDTGGAGGNGACYPVNSVGGGGAGNPPGNDYHNGSSIGIGSGQAGTGGLLIIYATVYTNNGIVESRGSGTVLRKAGYNPQAFYGGGGSGGGSVNIFYVNANENGSYNVSGGTYSSGGQTLREIFRGGNGGKGTVTLMEIAGPISTDVRVSTTTPWISDQSIDISISVTHESNQQVYYKVFVNNAEIMLSDTYVTPAEINIIIPVNYFNIGENQLVVVLIDENGIYKFVRISIIRENENTYSFVRRFNHKEGYITSENIEVIENHGIALKTPGTEFVTVDLPTIHKSKIESVSADCISDSVSPLKKVRFMVLKDDTYYTYNNGWQEADVSIENGMTKQQLEAITAEQWVDLEPSWFLHTFAVVIILQSEETGVGLIKKITVNFQEPITVLCDTITLHAPDKGLRNVLINGEYQLKIMPGIAFDDAEVDYNFYTTPDKIRFRPLNFGQVIGGSYTQIHAVEVINGYDDSDFNVVLFASKNNVAAEERDGYGLLYDSMRDVTRTRIEFSLVPPPNFDPVYPLTFQLDRLSSRIFYVRIKPALTITGDDTFQIRLLGRVV